MEFATLTLEADKPKYTVLKPEQVNDLLKEVRWGGARWEGAASSLIALFSALLCSAILPTRRTGCPFI